MDRQRRDVLRGAGGLGIWTMLVATGLVTPADARAARDNAIFDATSLDAALNALGALSPLDSDDIRIVVPGVAEDGRAVPLGVVSRIPRTTRIVIVIEENPYKVAASFVLSQSMVPEVYTRVKMNRSTTVHALVRADDRFFVARRDVRVTIGGCGL